MVGRCVLLVDDDVDFNEAVKLTLEAAGHEVVTAHSAAQAMAALEGRRIDIAILDMMMEEPDAGARVAHQLRRRPELAGVPVILVTSVTEKTGFRVEMDQAEARKWLGVDLWLDKPVDPQLLLEKIEALTGAADGPEARSG
jgi:CheY-like chemotaxis protein